MRTVKHKLIRVWQYIKWRFTPYRPSPELVAAVDSIVPRAEAAIKEAAAVYWEGYDRQFKNKG